MTTGELYNKCIMIKSNRWNDNIGKANRYTPFKIMGIVDKWVMMRRPKCVPLVAHINTFGEGKQYQKVEA